MANPALDTPTGVNGGGHTTVTYTSAGNINALVLMTWTKSAHITSVSSTSFNSSKWQNRKTFTVTHSGETLSLEIWWVPVAAAPGAPLTNEVITPVWNTGNAGLSMIAAGVSGVLNTNPFDNGASFPATGDNSSGSSVPSVTVTTTTPTSLIIGLVGTSLNQTLGNNPGASFTFDLHEHSGNGGPDTDLALEHFATTSIQSGFAATWGISLNEWTMLVDAFGSPPPTPLPPVVFFTNVTPH